MVKERDWSRWRLGAALGLAGGFLVIAVFLVDGAASPSVSPASNRGTPIQDTRIPGLVRPVAQTAADANLSDDQLVIGIQVDDRARAYSVDYLSTPQTHVVNDVLAGRPVTVTYCNVQNCARVFAGDGADPLDVGVGGYDQGLLLLLNGQRYRQESGDGFDSSDRFPYLPQPFVRTTWKKWREAHPDTEIVGG